MSLPILMVKFSKTWPVDTPSGKTTGMDCHFLLQEIYSRGSSQPRNQPRDSCGSCIAGGFFTAETTGKPRKNGA